MDELIKSKNMFLCHFLGKTGAFRLIKSNLYN